MDDWIKPLNNSSVFKTLVIVEFELRKLRHDFTELVTRALQPALWLLIFGQVFARSGMMRTGIYRVRGLDAALAETVAQQLIAFDEMGAMTRDALDVLGRIGNGDDRLYRMDCGNDCLTGVG